MEVSSEGWNNESKGGRFHFPEGQWRCRMVTYLSGDMDLSPRTEKIICIIYMYIETKLK